MRRRTGERDSEIPSELRSFTPGDWPGETDLARFDAWCAARREYTRKHGWPGGAVTMVREHRDIRIERELFGSR